MPIIDTVYPPTHTDTPQTHTHTQRLIVLQQFPSALWATLRWCMRGGLETETESKNKQSSGYERLFQNSFVILWQANENFPNYVQAKSGGRGGAWQWAAQGNNILWANSLWAQFQLSRSLSVLLPHHLWSSANADEVFPRRLSTSPPRSLLPPSRSFVRDVNLMKKSTPSRQSYHSLSLSLLHPIANLQSQCDPNRLDFESESSRGNPCWHIPYCRKNMT